MTSQKLIKILSIVSCVLIAGYAGSTAYNAVQNNYKTQTAYITTVSESTDADIFIIRSETILDETGKDEIVVPLAVNGERVSNGSKIAAVFDSEEAAENYSNIISVEKKLSVYKKIDSQVKLANLDLDKLQDEINSDLFSILTSVYDNDFSDLSDDLLSFDEKLSRKNISLGYDVECSEQISQLQDEINAYSSAVPKKTISATSAGYYVSRPDGYEDVIKVEDIDSITPDILKEAFEAERKEVSDSSIGKIINGYDWYAASYVSSSAVANLKSGNKVTLILGDDESEKVSATVYSNKLIEENKSLVVFKCSYMSDALATLRKVNGKIVTGSYKGIKVRKDAVRFNEDGDKGVYIREGNLIKFNKIEEIYSNEDYVVAMDKSGSAGWLSKYDEIVISGKELSNGKVLD